MKILLIMDPYIPVPPPAYGGHERLVAMFAKEYEQQGHEVTLLAGPGSKASTVYIFGENNPDLNVSAFQRIKELVSVWKFLSKNHSKFDVIHNFGRLLYLLPVLNKSVNKIMTYGREITSSAIQKINLLPNKNLIFTACSNYCVSTGNTSGTWKTVYNAIEFSKYSFKNNIIEDAPLIFLGRIEKLKGTHHAIKVAKSTGNRLWIAGNIAKEHETFFNNEIKPHLNDRIIHLGPLNDIQKNDFLGRAKALLFPIEWNEPFGMVMVESMACGTPVIAIVRGSVEEVIDDGITGIKVSDVDEMIDRLNEVFILDRKKCRDHAFHRFDVKKIAMQYLSLIEKA